MAANLTDQVRGIVKVVTAVANGDLKQKLTVQAKGEVAALADTINNMTDTLATFADQVTTVAREVGVEGRLGGQANVPGAAGTWKDLTGNVNLLAANLTTQVRAIAEVATAVTKGDLTRSIQVEARGEVAELKDNINTMIDNLRDTTERNTEQDWLKTNLAKFTNMLQGSATWSPSADAALGAGAAGQRAAGRRSIRWKTPPRDEERPALRSCCRLRPSRATAGRTMRSARAGRPVRGGEERRILLTDVPPTTSDQLRPRRGAPATSSCCRCCSRARPRR
jgi:HAMP domain-containing protein